MSLNFHKSLTKALSLRALLNNRINFQTQRHLPSFKKKKRRGRPCVACHLGHHPPACYTSPAVGPWAGGLLVVVLPLRGCEPHLSSCSSACWLQRWQRPPVRGPSGGPPSPSPPLSQHVSVRAGESAAPESVGDRWIGQAVPHYVCVE